MRPHRISLVIAITLLLAIGNWGASSPANATPPSGNNGDVKIHEANTEVEPIEANDPKVCSFHVHGFNFDPSQHITWWVETQPGEAVAIASEEATVGTDGEWTTTVRTLANGQYKLYWEISGDQGSVKHKVFKVECPTPPPTGTLVVTKYNDANGSHTQDTGEALLSGWTFTAVATGTTVNGETASGGTVSFDVPAGTYTVTETLKAGWTNTDPVGAPTKTVTVVAGQTARVAFGNKQNEPEPETGILVVKKYNDANGNGRRDDGEALLAGWTFTVGDGETSQSAATGSDGTVSFDDLPAGAYTVAETQRSGWTNTDPAGSPASKSVTVVAGGTVYLAFGNKQNEPAPTTGTLIVKKYNDANGNGRRDDGEALLDDWTFTVVGGGTALSAATDDGIATFAELQPRQYTVTETQRSGWTNTDPGGSGSEAVTVTAGQTSTVWFGNRQIVNPTPPPPGPGTLRVVKYNDLDRDGARDENEPALAGVSFRVSAGSNVVATITTDAQGIATLTLNPGVYGVGEVQLAGWVSTDPGGSTAAKSAQITHDTTTTVLFGNAQVTIPSTSETLLVIGKYFDANANGTRDNGEPMTPGASFTIRDATGAILRTVTTGSTGIVVQQNLPLGTYTVTEQPIIGYVNTEPGGSAVQTVSFTPARTQITVLFGNAEVRLPSTSTAADGTTMGALFSFVAAIGAALVLFARRVRAFIAPALRALGRTRLG